MKKDMKEKRWKSVVRDIGLLVVMVGLGSWTYQQFSLNYRSMEASQQTLQALLTHQTDITQSYKQDLALVKERLDQAELFLNAAHTDLDKTQMDLTKAQTENMTLRQRIALLDAVAGLEGAISRLKEKNALLINHISSIKQELFPRIQNIKTLKQGRVLITKYHDRLRKIKKRIAKLKRKKRLQRIAAQKKRDQIMLLAGNNGYLLRNGKLSPTRIVLPVFDEGTERVFPAAKIGTGKSSINKDVNIEVTFVK